MMTNQHPNPLVASIVINNYNYQKYIGRAIESALAQDYPYTEVVVVDDGSTDNSIEIIKSFGQRITYRTQSNMGQGSAFNAGVELSTGDLLLFLDADDYFMPNKVSRIVELYQRHPSVEWIYHTLEKHREDQGGAILRSQTNNSGVVVSEHNNIVRRGTTTTPRPATSGLTFRRQLAERIFPIPTPGEAGINLSDRYISLLGQFLGEGMFIDEPLAVLWIHAENRYSGRRKRWNATAQRDATTAIWAAKFDDKLLRLATRDLTKCVAIDVLTRGLDNTTRRDAWQLLKKPNLNEKLYLIPLFGVTVFKTACKILAANIFKWKR